MRDDPHKNRSLFKARLNTSIVRRTVHKDIYYIRINKDNTLFECIRFTYCKRGALSWHGSFLGWTKKVSHAPPPLCLYWMVW